MLSVYLGLKPIDAKYEEDNKSLIKDFCYICGETRYIEKCHILPKSFDGLLKQSNLLEKNTVLLCPNCHKYFDNDLLKDNEKEIILPKVKEMLSIFSKAFPAIDIAEKKGYSNYHNDNRNWLKSLIS